MRAQDILPDDVNQSDMNGTTVRKGTVGAFLVNARAWCASATSDADRREAEQHMLEALPALHALGLFEVLAIRDERLRTLLAQAARS